MQAIPEIKRKLQTMKHNGQHGSCMCSSLQKFMHINANITSGFCNLFGINKKIIMLQRFLLRKRRRTQSFAQPSSCPQLLLHPHFKNKLKKKTAATAKRLTMHNLGLCSKDEWGGAGIFGFVVQGRVWAHWIADVISTKPNTLRMLRVPTCWKERGKEVK